MRLNRFSAAAIHLAISIAIAVSVFLAIYFLWYPYELFRLAGGRRLFLLIAGVDVGLGPLITLIIYVPGKKGLRFDLACIAAVQLAALLFGLATLFASRPVYIVFVKDRFELMRANDYPESELARARSSPYAVLPLTGPRIVGARMPAEREERERIMFLAHTGVDLQHMFQHYVPYDSVREEARAAAKPIARLREINRGRESEIDQVARELGRSEASLAYVPMRAAQADLAVIIDRATGNELKMLDLNPWDR